ncbi:PEGA domain-containing protein [Candidatus Saccharibacteria bacterium]|nr:PEGA domain-containing protein [Candidatus Saccharibacteria bacterium]
MHKRRTRNQQIAIRSFTYGVMMLLAAVGVAFCLAWAMGFRIDWNDGKLTQVALLQFNSFPSGATVDINGQVLSTKTPTRANVKTGETTVIMSRQGYRSWQKTVDMSPSGVVWLNYVRLIPTSILTDTVKSFASVSEMRESPDKKWLLIRHSDDDHCYSDMGYCPEMTREGYLAMPFTFTLIDVSNPKNIRFSELTIPSDKTTPPTKDQSEFFSIVEWDPGSRFVLIKHIVGEMTEYLRLDRSNSGEVKNLTRDFGMQISDPHFSGTSGNVFFALTGTDLRKFDYGNNTASMPLASNVWNYRPYENGRLALVSVEEQGDKTIQRVGIYNDGHVTIVTTYQEAEPTLAVLTRFNNVDYLAIARRGSIVIYSKPLDQDEKTPPIFLHTSGGGDWLNISPNGQFILTGYQGKLVSFDLDTRFGYSFEVKDINSAPQWLDNSHIVSTSDKMITFIEFDGQNREDIVGAHGRVTLSRDGKYLFSISDAPSGAMLQRSALVID